MGKWNKLTNKANLSRHPKSFNAASWGETKYFSKSWTPLCEMFGKKIYSHPWIKNSIDKEISLEQLTPHHLISISSLDYINKKYRVILTRSFYNVNHPKNILLLPNKKQMSCELRVPVHKGNHTEWGTVDNLIPQENIDKIKSQPNYKSGMSKGYHFVISGKVRKEIKKLIKKCKNYKCQQIVDVMDNLSKVICSDLADEKIKVNKSGSDYLPNGCGCGSCNGDRYHNLYLNYNSVRILGMTMGRFKTAYEIYK